MKKAVFFDRDGVLNVDKGYHYKIETFEWILGARETIKFLNNLEFLVIVITNQSGVSRGYFSEKQVITLHEWMNKDLKNCNAKIDDFFYSTELPSKNKKTRRKPNPDMINEAIIKYSIDRKKSFMIGDKLSDVEAAQNAFIKGYLFNGGNLLHQIKKILKEF
tara:strand:- start:443 stop:928 length:486 start_codon:yes stop_codon:yes gene_type:complete